MKAKEIQVQKTNWVFHFKVSPPLSCMIFEQRLQFSPNFYWSAPKDRFLTYWELLLGHIKKMKKKPNPLVWNNKKVREKLKGFDFPKGKWICCLLTRNCNGLAVCLAETRACFEVSEKLARQKLSPYIILNSHNLEINIHHRAAGGPKSIEKKRSKDVPSFELDVLLPFEICAALASVKIQRPLTVLESGWFEL